MAQTRFTDMFIRNLKTKQIEYQIREHADRREESGFGIRVFPNGAKHWIFVYRQSGKRRIMTLGHYPEMSLADARAEFQKKRVVARKEKLDPIAIRQAEKDSIRSSEEERLKAPTVSELVTDYLEKHAKRFKRSWQEDERILNRDVIPAWGKIKAEDIRRRDINTLLEGIVGRGAPVMANNTFKIIRKMFNWAAKNDLIPISPAIGIDLPTPKVDRSRVLSETEIRTLWKSLDTANMSDDIKNALKLVLVTAQRPNEVVGMHTSELTDNWWTIPVKRQKVAKAKESVRSPHRLFLTKTARDLIGSLEVIDKKTNEKKPKGYIFPCPHKKKDQSINRHALSRAVVNNCPSGCINDCDACDNEECKADGLKLDDKNKLGIAHFTPHDLRRTAATFMAEMGTMDEVIDAILNHAKQGVIKVYNVYRYDKEKQAALEAWERKLATIIKSKPVKKTRH
jgi:integrase